MADELAAKLNSVLSELKTVMQQRKDRIEELRAEIEDIEASNEDLEKQISTMLESFQEGAMKKRLRVTKDFDLVLAGVTAFAYVAFMVYYHFTFN